MVVVPNDINLKKSLNDFLLIRKVPGSSGSFQVKRYKFARLNLVSELKRFKGDNPGFNVGPFVRLVFFLVRHNCYHPHLSGLTHVQVSDLVYGSYPSKAKKLGGIVSRVKLKDAVSNMRTIKQNPPYTGSDYDLLDMLCY
ncbi:hypothetical protein ACIPM0_15895 [Pseudomonas sichuanensis]|uniref:hypothetical protein n=1 Tax=Pseudomonas sichuanensis TaxID=2213015 RepID=UPI0037F15F50